MKQSVFPFVLIFSLFITFFSCSNKPKRSRKPVSTITITPKAKNYIYGNKVAVNVETKVKNGKIDNIQLFYQGKLLKESNELNFTVSDITFNEIGENSLNVVATKTDGVNNTRSVAFNVVSDIAPKKYSYSIQKDYPHNHKFYTQGLEFYNGHIYEGTGENGSSGLFKVNLNTGETIMQHHLDDKYFGEGITIFNDKIYQLTYRAQKGFVYNLSDFALVDSFSYNSKEGWGLTNDGTYLIMNNGGHELIWLNPTDFSEVKRVQVANNKGVVNYLNEMEYIDGTIYANVYTTNLIVQIEPETGKVLSEINLEGILNMYTNQNDTVDYLNGIAYDSENKRLFVTGKWWPRMFEIELIESK
ncbi:Glutamine cyclotransferase [Mariniphaga anaerophila]|uniref:Glutamine cyclotransferase n=1 Tax=Mariniphaga anaerophila TaxID=1484053 RepID=A0A1M5EKX2_9BACT|nr:glutaminyl-peptide cyclotransferase [Mariniphaga anaerophila]SHF79721.1 Glutamine cyclotransferase [Mariniphaga anaerophila]